MEQQKLGVQEQKDSQTPGIGDGIVGMLNIFIDPKGAAKRIPAPLSWLWPLITLTIIYVVFGYLMLPYIMNLIDIRINQQISQQNTPVQQAERARNIAHAIYQFYPLMAPVLVVLLVLLFAWLVCVMGSIAGLRAKFRDVFSLMMCCSLISALQVIAGYVVLHAKGDEITSQDQLTPPFGLDIFLQNIHGALLGLVSFFSIFEIWYLIVLTVALAALAKSTKGKAFFAITPAWVLPLIIKVVQGMLQGGQGS
ncbi:MAG TPA: YIP1 family protein [Bryobacteraceae bacterium]|nr:YIP1 family protein [Bryobacteraceae bacterium]